MLIWLLLNLFHDKVLNVQFFNSICFESFLFDLFPQKLKLPNFCHALVLKKE